MELQNIDISIGISHIHIALISSDEYHRFFDTYFVKLFLKSQEIINIWLNLYILGSIVKFA